MIYLIDPQNPGIEICIFKFLCPKDRVVPLYGIDPVEI